MTGTRGLDEIVDIARYPLTDLGGSGRQAAIEAARAELAEDGCTVLREFIRPQLLETLRTEGEAIAPHAHYKVERVNAYNIPLDADLPADHPARIVLDRGNAFVARDRIPAEALIQRLYTDPVFQRFVADCFELDDLHEFADPLAGLCLNVVEPGMSHPWHFDTNEFTVSMLTRKPEAAWACSSTAPISAIPTPSISTTSVPCSPVTAPGSSARWNCAPATCSCSRAASPCIESPR